MNGVGWLRLLAIGGLLVAVGCSRESAKSAANPIPGLEPFDQQVLRLPQQQQIKYWIEQLESLSEGKPCDVSLSGFNEHVPLTKLKEFGEPAVLPLLDLLTRYSTRSEWDVPNPTEATANILPFSDTMVRALWYLQEMKIEEPTLEQRLLEILRNSCEVNEGQQLWGYLPVHTADTLYKHFPGYPEPQMLGNNALESPEQFLNSNRSSAP